MTGIVGYGVFIPKERLTVDEIWDMWCTDWIPYSLRNNLKLGERAVNHWDEDAITMGIEASRGAIEMAGILPERLGAVYFGSCTNTYTTKSSGTFIIEALGTRHEILCADVQFGGKSGTAAMQICAGLIKADMVDYAMAIGSDSLSRHIAPNDFQEFAASAGAFTAVLGKEGVIAEIEGTFSYTTETPEYFRLDGDRYIRIAGEKHDVDKVGYRRHILASGKGIMEKYDINANDFSHIVLHQPDGSRPFQIGKELGFSEEKIALGVLVSKIGDCGSASALLGLANVLDHANPGERILLISYGYGAGSDAFILRVTDNISGARARRNLYPSIEALIEDKEMIDYKSYLRMERKLIQEYE